MKCVVPAGSIWFNKTLKIQRPNYIGAWHEQKTFSCSCYYGYWGEFIAQQNYVMMPFGEVVRRKDWLFSHFGTEKIFVRPDSGEKEFTGEPVERGSFDAWATRKYTWDNTTKDLMCVVAPPLHIKKELRLLIKDGKVITGSVYKMGNHIAKEPLEIQNDQSAIIEFAESVNSQPENLPLPPVYVLDVALLDKGYTIMEIDCCCCCGRYEMDMRKFTKAISEAAEEAFEHASNK